MRTSEKIEALPVEALVPYARNARTHSETQVAQIAASIKEFGFTNPILIDHEGGIIAGHGRVLAARKLGMESVPCIRLGWLTENQKRAYILADNKLALNAGWDDELLALELEALKDADYPLELTGFPDILIVDGTGEDKAGASPWDRIGAASAGVMFSFGDVHARLEQETYNSFKNAIPPHGIEEWLNAVIREACNNH